MVIGYHIAFGAYGFWLPNDPRGSGSSKVWAQHLRPFGIATKVGTRTSVAHKTHDRTLRLEAKRHLNYPAVQLSGVQARAVGRGFAEIVQKITLRIYACAIMPDHMHLVAGRHRLNAEDMVGYFKRAGTRQLAAEHLHPFQDHQRAGGRTPSPWSKDGWNVYLNRPEEMRRCIRYVEENPVKAGLPPQRWPFVISYEG